MWLHVKQHVLTLAILVCSVSVVTCHPQCLDFRAPFKPEKKLKFCSRYSDFGCCGSADDRRIISEYKNIRSLVDSVDWGSCQGYVQDILCQKCSPYAAHIYDAEGTSKPRTFPGLCTNYCLGFYDKCRSLIKLLYPALTIPAQRNSKQRFCEEVALNDVLYCYPDLLTAPLLLGNLTSIQNVSATPGCLCLETIRSDLANPLWAGHAGDGSGRLFIAEQKGRVRIYNTRTKKWNKNCFLDFTAKVVVGSYAGDERGFLGLAFHPSFAINGRFFVYYSTNKKPTDVLPPEMRDRNFPFKTKIVISELRVSGSDPDKADPTYEKILLQVFQPYENHNGGELLFGLDRYLYAFIGDGGGAGDPLNAGQNKSLLLGKVIRIDVDSDPSRPYSIPKDNPFVGEPGSRPEIYAFGIRNIWRCGLDKGDRVTGESRGRMFCGDVGQNAYEEIDDIKKGGNYGWNAREGLNCYNHESCGRIGPEELPIHAYSHKIGQSVTGGVFYRGCENPHLIGQYIYGDYSSARLFSLTESGGVWTNKDVNLCGPSLCQGGLVGISSDHILSFGEDEDGEIYLLTSKSSSSTKCDGKVYKIIDPVRRKDPSACRSDLTRNKRIPVSRRQLPSVRDKDKGKKPAVVATINIRTWRKDTNNDLKSFSSVTNSGELLRLNLSLAQRGNLRQQSSQQTYHSQYLSTPLKESTNIADRELNQNFVKSSVDQDDGGSLGKNKTPSNRRQSSAGQGDLETSHSSHHHYHLRSPTQTQKRRRKTGKKKQKTRGNRRRSSADGDQMCSVCGD